MKITKSQLKQIIKEELNEFGGMAGNLAASRMGAGAYKRDDDEEEDVSEALGADQEGILVTKVLPILMDAAGQNVAVALEMVEALKAQLQATPAEGEEIEEDKAKDNPWAICTASVGREDKEKYEKCVMGVKKEKGIK